MVAVAGPTGSGKSDLALLIAEEFHGEIVNCDSLQVYRHFDIGTAKLPLAERRGIPHHLIDILDPDELFTAGEYARVARDTIADISARGRLPILAGGTGFYLRALFDGLFEGPARDQPLRDRLAAREARRAGSLHRILTRLDSVSAAKIHANDIPKVTRALEVCLLTRRPVSELFRAGTRRAARLSHAEAGTAAGSRRALSAARRALRVDVRKRTGGRGAAAFWRCGFAPECKPFESHGYKQALQLIRGELNPRDAVFYAQRNTRNYAKRQITWFRREAGLVWLKDFGDVPEIRETALARVAELLAA